MVGDVVLAPFVLAATCHYRASGALPDRRCTPGALNAAVTQKTIHRTICVHGWTAKIRPPESVTEPEKLASMKQYGVIHPSNFEYDHLISLELGGAPNSPRNLWPEPHHTELNGKDVGSFAKDVIENRLHAEVCSGRISLAKARTIIRTDWRKAP